MKNILIVIMLAALFSGVSYAQESEAQSTKPSEVENVEDKSKFKMDINFDDDELSTDEKFEMAKRAIKDSVSEDFAKDIEVEIDGLTEDEKAEIVSALEHKFRFNSDGDSIPAGAIAIALPAIILLFGMPIFIVLLVLWFGHKKRRQKLEIINTYLDANQEVPDQVLNAFDPEHGANSLRKGILLTGVGLGIVFAFGVFGESEIGGLGFIPLFMGVARLVYWYIEERKV